MLPILALLALSLSGSPSVAQGTSSVCKDGTTSAVSGRGACSSHGGVDAKATAAAAKATVTCTDGTSSAGGRGACSSHGGIAKAVAKAPASAMKAAPAKPDTAKKPSISKGPAKTAAKTKPKG